MGCGSSKHVSHPKRSLAELQKERNEQLEKELHELMHEEQTALRVKSRPLLESRASVRDLSGPEDADLAATRERLQVRQQISLREAEANEKWMVYPIIVCVYSCV